MAPQLDPMAPDFHLIVDPALKPENSLFILAYAIARTVVDRAKAVPSGILSKPDRSFFRVGIIAQSDARAANP